MSQIDIDKMKLKELKAECKLRRIRLTNTDRQKNMVEKMEKDEAGKLNIKKYFTIKVQGGGTPVTPAKRKRTSSEGEEALQPSQKEKKGIINEDIE